MPLPMPLACPICHAVIDAQYLTPVALTPDRVEPLCPRCHLEWLAIQQARRSRAAPADDGTE